MEGNELPKLRIIEGGDRKTRVIEYIGEHVDVKRGTSNLSATSFFLCPLV